MYGRVLALRRAAVLHSQTVVTLNGFRCLIDSISGVGMPVRAVESVALFSMLIFRPKLGVSRRNTSMLILVLVGARAVTPRPNLHRRPLLGDDRVVVPL